MGRRGWRPGAAAVVAVLAALCAGAQPAGAVRTAADPGPLPADRYTSTAQDDQQVRRATALLVRACMAGRGHPDFPLDPGFPGTVLYTTAVVVGYGARDLGAARRWGYGFDPAKTRDRRPQGREMTAAEFADDPGCNAEAQQRLTRGIDVKGGALSYAVTRAAAVDKEVRRDPRLRAAWAEWSRCMADRGFAGYPDPVAAATDRRWPTDRDGNTPHSARERATAVADVLCKRDHRTVETWHAVQADHQAADIARHRDGYDATLRALRTYRANTAQVLRALG